MKTKIALFVSLSTIFLAVLSLAQLGNVTFPPNFQMNLNQLPPPQSPTQKFYGCDYGQGQITFRDSEIYNHPTALSPETDAQIRFWIDGKCAGSIRQNYTIAPALSSNQLATNFESAVNQAFLQEAMSNHQPTSNQQTPPVSSSTGSNSPNNPNSQTGGV